MDLRRVIALPLILLTSCGGPQKGDGKPSGVVKNYQPLAQKDDSKAKDKAVILGTDSNNGSTIVSLPLGEGTAQVDALFVRMGGKEAPSGGFSPVKLKTSHNDDGTVQVAIGEQMSGGAGPQWRAGVWISAFVAATTLNKDLTDFVFSASSEGYIDGASASGLMSAGFLASITGKKVEPNTTMTGIINPDGTIGPVGGIPEKFKGSIEKGKKTLGYPIGMRFSRSEASGEMVDLEELAKSMGAKAVEIANVNEAYKLLTGKTLPETVPVSEKDMQLDDETNKAIESKYNEWKGKWTEELKTLQQVAQSGKMPSTLLTIARASISREQEAEKLQQQGMTAIAYDKMLSAWVYAASATETYDILTKVQAGDIKGAAAQVGRLEALQGDTIAMLKKVGEMKPTTLGGHLLMLSAFQAALRGWGFKATAGSAVARTKRIVALLAPTVLTVGRTVVETKRAEDELNYMTEKSISYMCSLPNVKRMSTSFASASAAGITYFDNLLLLPLAKQAGIPEDQARERVAMMEPNYLIAYMTSHLANADGDIKELKDAWTEKSIAWGLMTLAGSEMAYFDSAILIAKYYSLGVHTDYAGRADKVEHEKAFINMLASAERSAGDSMERPSSATHCRPWFMPSSRVLSRTSPLTMCETRLRCAAPSLGHAQTARRNRDARRNRGAHGRPRVWLHAFGLGLKILSSDAFTPSRSSSLRAASSRAGS
ncbi:MAG: hypothetical protein NT062_18020 [Proteobacteria bacterium]|nr:hypothetical protein [Pseudomonadota bacterium]